ncbi:hypothetical protein AAFF_G00352710 [Aldrovandia affinis]|uniref:Uncharacterized protein n=1 Tax=Aldrovandia affinis TaxID=143900 RepID=A0AAD7WPF2_9TELE|nr:hypothetical protein AAFF_G00352710 [Aldrovandia affinis]
MQCRVADHVGAKPTQTGARRITQPEWGLGTRSDRARRQYGRRNDAPLRLPPETTRPRRLMKEDAANRSPPWPESMASTATGPSAENRRPRTGSRREGAPAASGKH